MDAEDRDPARGASGSGRKRFVAVIGAAALAIPGGAIVSNALAADSGSDTSTLQTEQVQEGYGTAPSQGQQQERPDGPGPGGRDCPEEGDGSGSGSGSSGSSSGSSGAETGYQTSTEQTPL